jgi:hypothetical protein
MKFWIERGGHDPICQREASPLVVLKRIYKKKNKKDGARGEGVVGRGADRHTSMEMKGFGAISKQHYRSSNEALYR